ncbi:NACHT, LRR and PYD domains-containing protein 1b allele 2-like [Pyxicephalus adspersus]|uniref:NACHT, LRR and PYD domains-containing protein 1b allele 2-like n=1 Tax=Pyxicephalus adspersus TaxID=30357 RepID=UPI003B5B0790
MSVETPTRILPFHVVLENPSFSSLGIFLWNVLPTALTKRIPIHGKVFLYLKTVGVQCLEYKIHLYLMPTFAPVKKTFHQEKSRNGFRKLDKPPRTKTVYIKKSYTVNGPGGAHISPKELEVECISPLQNFTDITIDGAVQVIDLWLVNERDAENIWQCRLSRGEVEELGPHIPQNTRRQGEFEELNSHISQITTGSEGMIYYYPCLYVRILQI